MHDVLPNGKPMPEGLDYLRASWEMENRCESFSDEEISKLGVKAPICLVNLGTTLSQLDRLSSCFWGCSGGDHKIEYIAARVSNLAHASIRLMRFGFYDESLAITRSIGESANLLFLFFNDRKMYSSWSSMDESVRRREFSPVKVRQYLEDRNLLLPVDQERYSELSGLVVHMTPNTKPNAHFAGQRPTSGGYFKGASLLLALNELSGVVGVAAFALAQLADISEVHRRLIQKGSIELLRSVGGVSVSSLKEFELSKGRVGKA